MVNEILTMVVSVKELIPFGLEEHVGDLDQKVNSQVNVNVGAGEMT